MGFISTPSLAVRHDAYAYERTPPAAITATGTGVVGLVGQFAWGPKQTVTAPTSTKNMYDMFGPRAFSRTTSGYLSLIRKAFPTIKIVRVLGSSTVKAVATLASSTPTDILTVTAKYDGASGNSLVGTVSAASDGDSNHFNFSVTTTNEGAETDTFNNLNYSGTGTDSAPVFSDKLFIGALTKLASGRPANGTYTFSTGSDGTINAAAYAGTAGTGDVGIAKLEGDKSVRHVCVDDTGNSLRAGANAALMAHAIAMGDRVAYINGNSGLSLAAAQSDAASYRSKRVYYVDVWPYIADDIDNTLRLVPPAVFAASVKAQLSPSTSLAWKSVEVQQMLSGISSLESDRGNGAGSNSLKGIVTLITEEDGGFTFEAGYLTSYPVDPTTGRGTRTHMADYIAISFTKSVRGRVDSPNVPANRDLIVGALDRFMSKLKRAQNDDPDHTPHVIDYSIAPLESVNSTESYAAGEFTIPLDVTTSSGMEKIFLAMRAGEFVVVTPA